jgi:hypothetical protein
MKIRSVGAELLHAKRWREERTLIMYLIIGFRNFATVPSKQLAFQNIIIRDIDMDVGLQP